MITRIKDMAYKGGCPSISLMDDTHLDMRLRELEHAIKYRYLTPDSCIRTGIFAEPKHQGSMFKSVIKVELAEQSAFYQEVLEECIVMSKLAATAKNIGEFEGMPGEM